MENKKKVFVFLPDGVGLRNFAFTKFKEVGCLQNFEVVYWNKTDFDLTEIGLTEIKVSKLKSHFLTDLFKRAKIEIELNSFKTRFSDQVYDSYKFPTYKGNFKAYIKFVLVKVLILFFQFKRGHRILQHLMNFSEKRTSYYKQCLAQLKKEKPAFIFCTNQRPVLAISPILAAKEIGIPTATFIFSWDNLPKATLVIETDYYFVWSKHMKEELLKYYPHIKENQVKITGTPQFEPHYQENLIISKQEFFKKYNLDENKKYICFSGDDEVSSPNDPEYLKDLAESVLELNKHGYQLGIIFRKCPVDFSGRYNHVLHEYKEVICSIDPLWKKKGDYWNSVMPTKEDLSLLISTIFYSEFVINVGSSMVFDFICFNKTCCYVNYDVPNSINLNWSTNKSYNLVHFRSMPSKDSVVWINSKVDLEDKIKAVIKGELSSVTQAKEWFEKIVVYPVQRSSDRIWKAIDELI